MCVWEASWIGICKLCLLYLSVNIMAGVQDTAVERSV